MQSHFFYLPFKAHFSEIDRVLIIDCHFVLHLIEFNFRKIVLFFVWLTYITIRSLMWQIYQTDLKVNGHMNEKWSVYTSNCLVFYSPWCAFISSFLKCQHTQHESSFFLPLHFFLFPPFYCLCLFVFCLVRHCDACSPLICAWHLSLF